METTLVIPLEFFFEITLTTQSLFESGVIARHHDMATRLHRDDDDDNNNNNTFYLKVPFSALKDTIQGYKRH